MSLRLNKRQKKILEALIKRIEGRTYEGRRVSVRPEQIWKGYTDDFADINEVEEFEVDADGLERAGLISTLRQQGRITRIREVPGKADEYYALTGLTLKEDRVKSELDIYRSYRDESLMCRDFCDSQIELIDSGKKAEYTPERGEKLCRLLKAVSANVKETRELLERELSVSVLGDSKEFEKHFRTALCNIIATVTGQERGKGREWEKSILEQYGIVANPSYIYIKGDVSLKGTDGRVLKTFPGCPAAVSADFLSGVSEVSAGADTVMTVENLTSFHRVDDRNRICIYTGGYHSVVVKELLQMLGRENDGIKWFHFGDIDPDGFYILKNLRAATGLDFKPYMMDEETLLKYRDFARPLTEGDRVKCERLTEEGDYSSVIRCMLEEGIKLEQEIVGG